MATLLANWMHDHGLKDKELAVMVELSRVQVLRLRRGQYRPSLRTARKLEKITGLSAGSLMTDGAG